MKPPRDQEDWQAYHALRRRALFEARGRFGIYDHDHPDEHREGNHPLLLCHDGVPIGTVRIDYKTQEQAVIRLVTIREDLQGRGHGRHLILCAERFIQGLGRRSALVNAAPAALARTSQTTERPASG